MSTDLKTAVDKAKKLPHRQRQILQCLARGLLAKETADELGIATGTVSNMRTTIYRKLGVNNSAEAIRVAVGAGLI